MPALDLASTDLCPLVLTADTEFSLLAANDPVFTDLKADDYKFYVRFRIATAFPNVIGPEMHGRFFGFHPQVLANSFRTLLHQQINIGHNLKIYGAYRDRIIGSAIGVSVGNLQRTPKQTIADTVEAAQYLDVIGVISKQAEGVKDLLGNHTSARQKQSVSIESGGTIDNYAIYDPRDRSIIPIPQAMEQYPKLITFHKERGMQIGKVDGVQLALANGGENGIAQFRGVGMTPTPAETKTAKIIDLRASLDDDIFCAALRIPEWDAGQPVRWKQQSLTGDSGRGTVSQVIIAGSVSRHGFTKTATPDDPLLEIAVHGKALHVIRHSSSVSKIS